MIAVPCNDSLGKIIDPVPDSRILPFATDANTVLETVVLNLPSLCYDFMVYVLVLFIFLKVYLLSCLSRTPSHTGVLKLGVICWLWSKEC